MSTINQVQKKGIMNQWDIVKFQILIYCYFNEITICDSDLECLTLLALNGESELTDFCNAACDPDNRDKETNLQITRRIFTSPQSVRNCVNKAFGKRLLEKVGTGKKRIVINPEMKVQSMGNILVDMKFLRKDGSQESQ